ARGRRVGAMRCPKGVVHVDVGQAGELAREARVVLLLLGVEAQVLEDHRARRPADEPLRRLADAVRRELHAPPERPPEVLGGRRLQARLRPTSNATSRMRIEKPHSLSYQDSTLQNVLSITRVSRLSKIDEYGVPLKSADTSGSSQ